MTFSPEKVSTLRVVLGMYVTGTLEGAFFMRETMMPCASCVEKDWY